MKAMWGILVILLCLGGAAMAQEQPSADHIVAKMTKVLGLSQDQVASVSPIITDSLAQRAKLMEKMQAEIASIHSQMEKLKKEEKQKLSQILTKDQMDLWNAVKNKKHVRHNADGSGSLKR